MTDNIELIDIDSGFLAQADEEMGDIDVFPMFPVGRYAWNIDRINIVDKLDDKTGQVKHDTMYVFRMFRVIQLQNKEEEVPEEGSKAMMYIANPVQPLDSPYNIGWKEAKQLRKVALGEEQLREEPYRNQLKMMEQLYKEDNLLLCSIKHQRDKNTGEVRMKFNTDWEVYEE